jgi:hypothetical protein
LELDNIAKLDVVETCGPEVFLHFFAILVKPTKIQKLETGKISQRTLEGRILTKRGKQN